MAANYGTPRSPLRHIATPPLTSPGGTATSPHSAHRHKEEVEELRSLQKRNSELRRALTERKAYPWPSSAAKLRETEYAAAAAPRPPRSAPRPPSQSQYGATPRPPSAAHVSGRSQYGDAPVSRSHYSPTAAQSSGRRALFDEDGAEARRLVESAAATVSSERHAQQEARVAEATQRALQRLNELETQAAAAERRVRGAEDREATLRRVVDAAKADVERRSGDVPPAPSTSRGWLSTLLVVLVAFAAGLALQAPLPTYVVTH